jgi:hypothetical protein
MIAAEATLAIPIWLAVLVLTLMLLFAAWPEHVRPRLVRWRKRRRNARRILRS